MARQHLIRAWLCVGSRYETTHRQDLVGALSDCCQGGRAGFGIRRKVQGAKGVAGVLLHHDETDVCLGVQACQPFPSDLMGPLVAPVAVMFA